jgi:hypothetical protein
MNDDAKSKFHMNEELVRNGLKDIGLDIDIPADVDLFYHVLGRSWELMSEKERIDMRGHNRTPDVYLKEIFGNDWSKYVQKTGV